MVMWGLYVDCTSSAVEYMYSGMHICSGPYGNNVKYMYTRVPAHIVDCSVFTEGMCADIEVSYVDVN